MRRPPASPSSHTPSSFNASLASCVPSAPRLGICLHQYNFVSSLLYSYERTRHTTSRLCCGALFPLHFSNSRPPHPHPCLPLSPLLFLPTDTSLVCVGQNASYVCPGQCRRPCTIISSHSQPHVLPHPPNTHTALLLVSTLSSCLAGAAEPTDRRQR